MTGDILPEVGAQPGVRALETRWPEPAPSSGGRCAPTSRYRGSVLAELARRSAPTLVVGAGSQVRALAAVKALQAQARAIPQAAPALLELAATNNQTNPRSCAETGT